MDTISNPRTEPGEVCLVRRAQAGDRNAFDQLARHYRPILLALAFLRTSDMEAAEDLVQEVLTRAWQKLSTLEQPGAFLPWVRSIAANACHSWYRRSRPWPASLGTEEEWPALVDPRPLPLQVILARERQRALRQALMTIPEANRMSLMLHVWGRYSYEEIARVTAVPLTTVEGRIHRAKRQLRRLLRDAGAEFPGETRRVVSPEEEFGGARRQRRRPMTHPTTSDASDASDLERQLALVLFSYQFSALIGSGISLVRALQLLRMAPAPYGEAAAYLQAELENGESLSRAMSQRSELFPHTYRTLVRAGEVGGILEETLARAADVMTREWKLVRRAPAGEETLILLGPYRRQIPGDWSELTAHQRSASLVLFCETLGMLLVSGVPILQAMQIVGDLLPAAQKKQLEEVRDRMREGERICLDHLGILPEFVHELIRHGEENGCLDAMLEKAADVFEQELECRSL